MSHSAGYFSDFDDVLKQGTQRTFSRKEQITVNDDRFIGFITSGSIRLMDEDSDGQETFIADLKAGEILGVELIMLGEAPTYQATVITEFALVTFLSKNQLNKLLTFEPKLGVKLLTLFNEHLAKRLSDSFTRMHDAFHSNVKHRVKYALYKQCMNTSFRVREADGITIKITCEEIARIVGCSREMAGRTFKEMTTENWCTKRGKQVRVFNASLAEFKG